MDSAKFSQKLAALSMLPYPVPLESRNSLRSGTVFARQLDHARIVRLDSLRTVLRNQYDDIDPTNCDLPPISTIAEYTALWRTCKLYWARDYVNQPSWQPNEPGFAWRSGVTGCVYEGSCVYFEMIMCNVLAAFAELNHAASIQLERSDGWRSRTGEVQDWLDGDDVTCGRLLRHFDAASVALLEAYGCAIEWNLPLDSGIRYPPEVDRITLAALIDLVRARSQLTRIEKSSLIRKIKTSGGADGWTVIRPYPHRDMCRWHAWMRVHCTVLQHVLGHAFPDAADWAEHAAKWSEASALIHAAMDKSGESMWDEAHQLALGASHAADRFSDGGEVGTMKSALATLIKKAGMVMTVKTTASDRETASKGVLQCLIEYEPEYWRNSR